jgi:hypothetical protein
MNFAVPVRETSAAAEPVDVVYSWVDDTWPGFDALLRAHATKAHDHDPQRRRDNLQTLKYSLRSLALYAPWIRHIYIVTCAPQVPAWLAQDRPGISIVHHDAFMDRDVLPTFNSFAISSFLTEIPGLSRRFLYFNDDMLLGAPVTLADFVDGDGRLRIYPRFRRTAAAANQNRDDISPWNASLAYSNHLLDEAFGRAHRRGICHVPLLIDRDHWREMLARWPDAFAHTRRSRFRAKYNIPSGHMYPYFLLATTRARMESLAYSYRHVSYCPVENLLNVTRLRFAVIAKQRPKIVCYNDGFGARPKSSVVTLAQDFLARSYPQKSPFEA